MLHIPCAGNPPALIDVAAGRVVMISCTIPVAQPELQAGHVRAIAVSSRQRVAALPAVPTLAEAGLPGYEATGPMVLYAPRGLADPILRRLRDATRRAMADPDFARLVTAQGFLLAPQRGPEATAAHVRDHAARWATLIRAAGIRL